KILSATTTTTTIFGSRTRIPAATSAIFPSNLGKISLYSFPFILFLSDFHCHNRRFCCCCCHTATNGRTIGGGIPSDEALGQNSELPKSDRNRILFFFFFFFFFWWRGRNLIVCLQFRIGRICGLH